MSEKTDIKSMDLEELKTFFSDMGEKAFRAKQVYEWLHVRQVESFEEMTNLSKTLRERLDETCRIMHMNADMRSSMPEDMCRFGCVPHLCRLQTLVPCLHGR